MISKFQKILFILALSFFVLPLSAKASDLKVDYHQYAFTSSQARLVIEESTGTNIPWEWEALSPVYQYSFKDFGFYDPSRPLDIKIHYSEDDKNRKQIFVYDSFSKIWRPLVSVDHPEEKYVTTRLTATTNKLVLLSSADLMTVGTASWYAYKGGDFAASPDFEKGSILRVYNLDNDKYIDVTINDWGPERDKFPDRVIDLDKVAFSKLAPVSSGLIRVRIEPIKIVVPEVKQENVQIGGTPTVTASSALVMEEKSGEVLLNKEASKQVPIASLTKLVAIKTFLDTKPSLNKVVTYKYQDEENNYRYCNPWESSKLLLDEGDQVTVEDLVYATLVGSKNNAIETLVRSTGLTRAQFVEKMNIMVRSLGVKSTHFIEPSGLSPENVSSALDYAIISKEILANPLIKKISTTEYYQFYTINDNVRYRLYNTNKLLKTDKYHFLGSKTGYLDEAGYCLMTSVKTGYGNLLVVNLNSKTKAENFLDNEQLIRYGTKLLKNRK